MIYIENGSMQKPKLKKVTLKKLAIGFTFISVTTTIVLTSGILSNTPLINSAGSSAVQPLMASFSNKYLGADLVTQAGGSGAGIRAIIDGTKEIGMASKNPKIIKSEPGVELTPEELEDELSWIERKIKTITIAWDGMGLVYKPSKPNTKLDVNKDTILNIYTAFAGNEEKTFEDLGVTGDTTKVYPYARSGGAVVSGTADAFYKDSKLTYEKNPELDDALIKGNYGKFTRTTSESNSQAWSFVKNENKIGSMVYLSAGFINNNRKEIEDNGFEIATYEGATIEVENITDSYNWYRPLNLMVSIEGSSASDTTIDDHNSQDLINWILGDEIAKNIIKTEGYIVLTEKQILDLMCLNKDGIRDATTFWTATDKDIFDLKLEEEAKPPKYLELKDK